VAATGALWVWNQKTTVDRKLQTRSILNRTEVWLAVIEDHCKSNMLSSLEPVMNLG